MVRNYKRKTDTVYHWKEPRVRVWDKKPRKETQEEFHLRMTMKYSADPRLVEIRRLEARSEEYERNLMAFEDDFSCNTIN